MICEKTVKTFCRDDLSKIENYEAAVADKEQTWVCHHRLELTINGEYAHTREELKAMGMYWSRPYFELIFLTQAEHKRLHNMAPGNPANDKHSAAMKGENNPSKRPEVRAKMSAAKKGKNNPSKRPEVRAKISAATKGKTHATSEETKAKISAAMKGHSVSEEHKAKISAAAKLREAKKREEKLQAASLF